jgi:hypothetical protein
MGTEAAKLVRTTIAELPSAALLSKPALKLSADSRNVAKPVNVLKSK